jgi:hypothetical protein
MPSLQENQATLQHAIASALASDDPAEVAVSKALGSGEWLRELQPRNYAVITFAFLKNLREVLAAPRSDTDLFFDQGRTKKILILLSVRVQPHCSWCTWTGPARPPKLVREHGVLENVGLPFYYHKSEMWELVGMLRSGHMLPESRGEATQAHSLTVVPCACSWRSTAQK